MSHASAGQAMTSPVGYAGRVGPRWLAGFWPPALAALLVFAVWEAAIWWFQLPNFVLPRPGEILDVALQHPEQLALDTGVTLMESLSGYVLGSLIGLALAIGFVLVPRLEHALLPLYVTVNSVPMIAYGPLAIIFLGIGSASKIVLVAVAVSYTVLINALAGLRSCDPGTIALLRSFGATRGTILLKLRLPGAMPAIFSGLRVAVVHAMILAVVLEMLGANAGLGWAVYKSTQMMNFVEAWAAVAASVLVSLVVYLAVSWLGRRYVWW
jgi:NitT/TauT family transport system permease protein